MERDTVNFKKRRYCHEFQCWEPANFGALLEGHSIVQVEGQGRGGRCDHQWSYYSGE